MGHLPRREPGVFTRLRRGTRGSDAKLLIGPWGHVPWTPTLGAVDFGEEAPGHEPADVFSYDPAAPVPSLGGRSCCVEGVAPIGPADQRPVEMMNQVLVYTSRPLDRDRLIVGTIRAELFASTTARDTDWTVKICDVHPDGRSINI